MKGTLDRYIAFGRNFFGPKPEVGFRVARHGNLPTCSEALRGVEYRVEGAAGVNDVSYVCMKDSANAYGWETSVLPGGVYTDEQARDAIGSALVAGNNIDITVNDGANTITVAVETLALADITDVTSSAAELNVLDGIPATLTATELGFVDGVTSAIQTQLNARQPLDSDLTTIAGLTATTNNFMVASGSAWASRTPTQALVHLGLDADLPTFSVPASTTISTFGASLVDDANAAAAIATLGLDADIVTLALPASTTISAFGATVIDDANAAAVIATLGLDADLATLALPASTTISAFGATLVDDADAATARMTLGVVAGGAGDIWVEKAGDTTTGKLTLGMAASSIAFDAATNDNYMEARVIRNATFAGDKQMWLGYAAGATGAVGLYADTTEGLMVNSTGVVVNESGADRDTRVEGDTDANLLFTDASTDRVGIGTATPSAKLHVNGAAQIDGTLTLSAQNIATDTTTGMKIGTATTQKLGFFNATPIVRGTAFTQTFSTASHTVPAATQLAAPAGGTGTAAGGWDTAANRNLAITSINAARTDIDALKQVVNGLIDDLQALGLLG